MFGVQKETNSNNTMKKEPTKGKYGMIEASKKEIAYFESFEGEPVDLNQLIAKSKEQASNPKSVPAGKA